MNSREIALQKGKAAKYLLDCWRLDYWDDRLEYDPMDLLKSAGIFVPAGDGFDEIEKIGKWMYDRLRDEEPNIRELVEIEYGFTLKHVSMNLPEKVDEYLAEMIHNGLDGWDPQEVPTVLRAFWDLAAYIKQGG